MIEQTSKCKTHPVIRLEPLIGDDAHPGTCRAHHELGVVTSTRTHLSVSPRLTHASCKLQGRAPRPPTNQVDTRELYNSIKQCVREHVWRARECPQRIQRMSRARARALRHTACLHVLPPL